jgi:hypothetical protein
MPAHEKYLLVKDFLENKPASHEVVTSLRDGVEIGLTIDSLECAYLQEEGRPRLEERAPKNPDVVFVISPDAAETLVKNSGTDVGEFGVEVLKQVLAGEVKIRVPGSTLRIMKNGYLGIIKKGGKTFMKYLASNGVSSLSKIPGIIKNLKNSK